MTAREKWGVALCFFLSGATSLVLETAWSKQLSYVLGNTLYAVATVVAAFMSGLAVGSALVGLGVVQSRRPLRAYAVLQVLIGICGVLSIPVIVGTEPVFTALYQWIEPGRAVFLLARFAVVFVVLALPVTLMGMTLPLIVATYAGAKDRFAIDVGVAYGVNTLGAVAGTLAAGFLFIPVLGIARTCLVVGVVDAFVGALALWLDRRRMASREEAGKAATEPPRTARRWSRRQWVVGAVYAASGALAMALEVAWFRLLGLTMGPTVYAFSVMLATFLLGIALGSAAGAWWSERTRLEGMLAMGVLEALLGAVVLAGPYYYNELPALHWEIFRGVTALLGARGFAVAQLAVALVVLLAPCIVLGALFPLAVRALEDAGPSTSAAPDAARLYLANTVGGIAGTLAAGFWLVPTFGTWTTVRGAGVGSLVLGATLCLVARQRHVAWRAGGAVVGLALAAALAAAAPSYDITLFNQGLYRTVYTQRRFDIGGARAEQLVYHREGVNAPVAVFVAQGQANLRVSGKADASTSQGDLQTQLFVALPMMFAPAPRRAAVIGYGSGMTVSAMLAHSDLQALDVVEIEQAVVDASPYFASINHDPFDDPRTHLVLEDGRTHLAHSAKTYDVIASEPSNPWMAGVANLFTVDFYRTVRARLAPDGVFGQWVQLYELSPETFAAIVATIAEVFPHVVVFGSDQPDAMVLASAQPIRLPYREFADRFAHDAVRASFARVGLRAPLDVACYARLSESQVAALAASSGARNTDDNVWLEYRMAVDLVRGAASSSSASVDGTRGEAQSAPVAMMLVDLAATRRLQTIEELLPGVPRDELVRELAASGSSVAPAIVSPGTVIDQSRETRERLVTGLRAELEAVGEPALGAAAGRTYAESERRRADRLAAFQSMLDIARGGPLDRALVEAALARAPDLPLALVFLGNLAYGAGDAPGAERAYRRALDDPSDPSCYYALVGLGNVAAGRGDLDTAVRHYEDAITRNPYLTNAFLDLAVAYKQRADQGSARRTLEHGLRFNPGDADLTRALASGAS